MIGIVLASHGGFAHGLYDTLNMLIGEVKQCRVVSLTPGMTPERFDVELEEAVDEVETGDGTIVFTDIGSGTPYNRALGLKYKGKNIEVICGTNVPMILELAFGVNGDKSQIVEEAIINGKKGIDRVRFDRETQEDDDDF